MKTTFLATVSTLIVALMLTMSACKKNQTTTYGQQVDNDRMVKTTLIGRVIDKNSNPIVGAVVSTGTHIFTSDQDGLFYFSQITTSERATLITVRKNGYFKSFKTIRINSTQAQNTTIMMEETGSPYNVSSFVGGNIVFENATINFQANAFVNKNSNAVYNGNVNVYARYIDPTESNFGLSCPGSLRAIATDGRERILSSYGMIDVEMYDDMGNELQLATGKPSEIRMPIPSSLISAAPAYIPLWHLSETNGMWLEEGKAQKVGTEYIGQVSHFSNWNCDFPNDTIPVTFTIIDANNNPLPGAYVNFTLPGNWGHSGGSMDANGYALCYLPPNETFTMSISTYMYGCPINSFSTTVSTTNTPLNLGNIVLPMAGFNTITVTGTVLDCNSVPSANGMVKVKIGPEAHLIACNANGMFTGTFNTCSALPASAIIDAYDMSANQFASSVATINTGSNNLGTLNACGSTLNFINFTSTLAGIPTSFSLVDPTSTLVQDYNSQSSTTFLSGHKTSPFEFVTFSFDGPQTTLGTHNLLSYNDHLDTVTTFVPTMVNITNYPAIGSDIEGNFTANITGMNLGARTINCSFKVKRTN